MQTKKLYRSRDDKVLTGLAGGVGKYFGIDSTLVRILLVVFEFLTAGLLIFLYFIVALFVPKEPLAAKKRSDHLTGIDWQGAMALVSAVGLRICD